MPKDLVALVDLGAEEPCELTPTPVLCSIHLLVECGTLQKPLIDTNLSPVSLLSIAFLV